MNNSALPTTLKRLVYANYDTAKAYQTAKLYYYNFFHGLKSRNRETVIVYQMGKLGSSTVVKSLQPLKNM